MDYKSQGKGKNRGIPENRAVRGRENAVTCTQAWSEIIKYEAALAVISEVTLLINPPYHSLPKRGIISSLWQREGRRDFIDNVPGLINSLIIVFAGFRFLSVMPGACPQSL
jgi:hypothetical protein